MTRPAVPPPARPPWYVRPRIVLPAVTVLVLLVALVTPTALGSRSGDQRLSVLSDAPSGARLFHDLGQRLGWQPEQRLGPSLVRDPAIVHAVLDPVIPLRITEVHELLEHVREGGGLLLVLGGGVAALGDTLHIARASSGLIGDRTLPTARRPVSCPSDLGGRFAPLWPGGAAGLWTLVWRAPPAGVVDTLLTVRETPFGKPPRDNPSMVGMTYGKGRIVIASDPDIFRTDVLRDCRFGLGVASVRALEYLAAGGNEPRRRIVFDEFHQGHGARPGSLRAVSSYLGGTPSGRFLFQLAVAGLVLLVAAAPRIVAPRDPGRLERRSPLEQVDALSRAYAQVGATRTSARRLVRGLRRRVERAPRGAVLDTDDRFLERLASLAPSLRDDVTLLRRALTEPLSVTAFAALGPALQRVESTLLRPRS